MLANRGANVSSITNAMITHAALKLKDTFAPRFVSIQSVLDSVDFLEKYEVILAKFSSSCICFIFELILCLHRKTVNSTSVLVVCVGAFDVS